MAPEQATGGMVDARSDIFSFGAMLYEMATGVRPFSGVSIADTIAAVIGAQPKPPTHMVPSLPREVERLILRCLRKEPERRYQTIRDVSLELQEIGEESDSGTLAPTDRPITHSRTRVTPAIIVLCVILATGVGAWLWRGSSTSAPAVTPPKLVPLTTLEGLEFHPALSPDGEQVAFTWDPESRDDWDVHLKLVGSSEVRRLTSAPGVEHHLAWAPDGRQIGFLRSSPDGTGGTAVFVLSPVTGAERRLAALDGGASGLSWSPDGQWLVTCRSSQPDPGVVLIPAGGGEPRLVASNAGGCNSAAFSPKGGQLAYVTCSSFLACRLEVRSAGGDLRPSGPGRVVAHVFAGGPCARCWCSPNGTA
jgi:Tol biopolymer transport system component